MMERNEHKHKERYILLECIMEFMDASQRDCKLSISAKKKKKKKREKIIRALEISKYVRLRLSFLE